ncbi:hypothetical protein CN059_27195 [Sinorhizobium medicae]|uniref:Uncharacterized protein n=1 Tax=Sinorhizobium medicae TaxID=110321 RepID=A0ABX4TAN2_9HYPH|nr:MULTISPECIES: hypothetical protein [Sinorhizobium]MDW9371009.1 hypothetical protein [Sinorhizobium meliloti]MDW9546384.1 hypothetical protein [Sinorhizobium meliloti]MDX0716616.1 hypothetical protein [Sinorhizobium medicae]MDX0845075.1 hypothetical protein [Sinorhizobium medicae]MDX1059645.1 hypothetical protein [Sinorhizobium medicae]
MNNQEKMRIVRKWGTCSVFANLGDFLSNHTPEGVSAIPAGRAHVFLRLKKNTANDRLVVIFGAAATRAPGRYPPFFNGVALSEVLNASVLLFDDVAHQFGDDVSIGWHIGTDDINLQAIVPQIIEHVCSQLQTTATVLTGGSAGGFAALYYGSVLPSTVMVVNPQTDILRYYSRHVRNFVSSCFGWKDGESLEGCLGNRVFSLPSYLAGRPPVRAVYLQNDSDAHHLERHAAPLARALGGSIGPRDASHHGIDFYVRNWGDDHAPLPPITYADCVNHILAHGTNGIAETLEFSLEKHKC